MRRMIRLLIALMLCLTPALSLADTRALLVACSDFITQPDLGSAISGNLHMIASALISADVAFGDLSIADGTIGSQQALSAAIGDAFGDAQEGDLSILYLCTHGVLSSADDDGVYLLLGDGEAESAMNADQLCKMVGGIQGEKLLILDACYSGALIGRGSPERALLPGSRPPQPTANTVSPFLADPSIHVLTSASGSESSWYYDGDGLSGGAVSYFASALSAGLGLYGAPEADLDGDGGVTLAELHSYLCAAVPSSSSQLLSARAQDVVLPVARSGVLSRPLTGFSYGSSLIPADDPTLSFSFTVTGDGTAVQYRLVEYISGGWDWKNAALFLDEEDGGAQLSPGRRTRSLTLDGVTAEDGGYLMLQVFSLSPDGTLLLCSERLIAVQPSVTDAALSISCPQQMSSLAELPIDVSLSVPAEITVSVYDAEGVLVRRLASSLLTRPAPGGVTHLYWDGRDAQGNPAPEGAYTIAAEARVGGVRQKAAADVCIAGS